MLERLRTKNKTFFIRPFSSKYDSSVFYHEKFDSFGDVLMLISGVLAFQLKCVSKGVNFVVACGVMRGVLFSSATFDAGL